jgi:hypothetical protein
MESLDGDGQNPDEFVEELWIYTGEGEITSWPATIGSSC